MQEKEVIDFIKKDGLLIITPVVNMIDLAGFEMHRDALWWFSNVQNFGLCVWPLQDYFG
jgi:hypothetical protein